MKGIIYKIECNINGEVYYGSTQQSLNRRMTGHQKDHKRWKNGTYHFVTSFQIIERGNYSYSLIETVECEDKHQLKARERFYIENNECINKYIPGRTKKEANKAYREQNKDKMKEQKKEADKAYREQNKDKIKAYKEANKEQTKEYNKQRYLKQKQLKEQTN